MTAPRTVALHEGRFRVSDDPDNVLGYLLNTFLDDTFRGEASRLFVPEGEGLAIPDTMLAVRALPIDFASLLPEQVPADLNREWWVVSRERLHGKSSPTTIVIEGDDLRGLLQAAGLM